MARGGSTKQFGARTDGRYGQEASLPTGGAGGDDASCRSRSEHWAPGCCGAGAGRREDVPTAKRAGRSPHSVIVSSTAAGPVLFGDPGSRHRSPPRPACGSRRGHADRHPSRPARWRPAVEMARPVSPQGRHQAEGHGRVRRGSVEDHRRAGTVVLRARTRSCVLATVRPRRRPGAAVERHGRPPGEASEATGQG